MIENSPNQNKYNKNVLGGMAMFLIVFYHGEILQALDSVLSNKNTYNLTLDIPSTQLFGKHKISKEEREKLLIESDIVIRIMTWWTTQSDRDFLQTKYHINHKYKKSFLSKDHNPLMEMVLKETLENNLNPYLCFADTTLKDGVANFNSEDTIIGAWNGKDFPIDVYNIDVQTFVLVITELGHAQQLKERGKDTYDQRFQEDNRTLTEKDKKDHKQYKTPWYAEHDAHRKRWIKILEDFLESRLMRCKSEEDIDKLRQFIRKGKSLYPNVESWDEYRQVFEDFYKYNNLEEFFGTS